MRMHTIGVVATHPAVVLAPGFRLITFVFLAAMAGTSMVDWATERRPWRERAIIYIGRVDDRRRSEACCLAHCEDRGYEVVCLIHDDDGSRWRSGVVSMLHDGRAEVLVTCAYAELDPNRTPRREVAGH